MRALLAPFVDRRTYQTLLFLLLAFPLAAVGAAITLAGLIATICLSITPLVGPAAAAFRYALGVVASAEAGLARNLLDADVRVSVSSGGSGLYGRVRAVLFDPSFWKQQAYQLGEYAIGGAVAVAVVALLGAGLLWIVQPVVYHWLVFDYGLTPRSGSSTTSFWHVDRLSRAWPFVPAGLVVLVATMHLLRPLRRAASRSVLALLDDRSERPTLAEQPTAVAPFALGVHASAVVTLNALLIAIWALTTRAYFWPEWTLIWLGFLLASHAAVALIARRPQRWPFTRALNGQLAVSLALWLALVLVWAATGRAYFWPEWVLLGLIVVAALHLAVVALASPDRRELAERVEVLTATRAGAVEEQEAKLRRIERDLHDGAQARLVALGISLGLAKQRFRDDPEGALQLVDEAQADARTALQELRDLARGVHPPVLADRGLEPALEALAASAAVPVELRCRLDVRPGPGAETAAYFVAAEALANASKHAAATRVAIDVASERGRVRVQLADDGRGGADPTGSGLAGLRRRVEALDGVLLVTSPAGGPTIVSAEMPCGS